MTFRQGAAFQIPIRDAIVRFTLPNTPRAREMAA